MEENNESNLSKFKKIIGSDINVGSIGDKEWKQYGKIKISISG